jgi:hypothetical protein
MTSTVTVKTADWPVEVTKTDHACEGQACTTVRVEPNSEQQFHLHATLSIGLVELPKSEVTAEPASEPSTGEGV